MVVEAKDDKLFLIKPHNIRYGKRVATNELIGTLLGLAIEGPFIPPAFIELTKEVIDLSGIPRKLNYALGGVVTGLAFGIEYFPSKNTASDLRNKGTIKTSNSEQVIPLLITDSWIHNTDRDNMGNLIFVPDTSSPLSRKMYAVDHGVAFGGPDWTAEQLELEKTDIRVENHLTFIHELANQQKGDLDKYLNKVESLTRADIYNILQQIPKGWGVSLREEVKLLDYLLIRQSLIRPTFTEAFKIW